MFSSTAYAALPESVTKSITIQKSDFSDKFDNSGKCRWYVAIIGNKEITFLDTNTDNVYQIYRPYKNTMRYIDSITVGRMLDYIKLNKSRWNTGTAKISNDNV